MMMMMAMDLDRLGLRWGWSPVEGCHGWKLSRVRVLQYLDSPGLGLVYASNLKQTSSGPVASRG